MLYAIAEFLGIPDLAGLGLRAVGAVLLMLVAAIAILSWFGVFDALKGILSVRISN